MDIRRTILWMIFSFALLLLWNNWQEYNGKPSLFASTPATTQAPAASDEPAANGGVPAAQEPTASAALPSSQLPASPAIGPISA